MVGTSHRSVSARPVGARLLAAMKAVREFPDGTTMTVRELGRRTAMGHSKVSRIFSGQTRPKPEDIRALGTAMGIGDRELAELVAVAHFDHGPQWIAISSSDRRAQLRGLLAFEEHAARLFAVTPLLIPGILQTPDYTRAMMRRGRVPAADIETRVVERSDRSKILIRRRNPVQLTALIGHEALLKVVGSTEIMVEQLLELHAWASDRPNIDIRIVPIQTDWHPALEGPYLLIEFDDEPSVVHLETRNSGLFLHQRHDVEEYRGAVDTVRAVAMDPDESRDLIASIAQRLEQTESESVA